MTHSQNIFPAFEQLNVLIIGDVMIDRYLWGNVGRISPEAPVPIVNLQHRENRLGGAANVALNIRAMGATPYLCSVIGKDQNAELFLDLLPESDLKVTGILQSEERVTTVKSRILANNQQLLRVDHEVTQDLSPTELTAFLEKVRAILDNNNIQVIVFQDYNKGVLSYPLIQEVLKEAIKRDIPTAVDPKFKNFWAYEGVTLFKPNLKEIRNQLPVEIMPEQNSLWRAAEEIRSKLGNHYTLITLSEKGVFIEGDGKSQLIPTHPRDIADVCGAGDTVISIAALGLGLKMDMNEMAALANLAGGLVCQHVGIVPIDRNQLKSEFLTIQQQTNLL